MAKLAATQSVLQRLLHQNPETPRQTRQGLLLGTASYVWRHVRERQFSSTQEEIQTSPDAVTNAVWCATFARAFGHEVDSLDGHKCVFPGSCISRSPASFNGCFHETTVIHYIVCHAHQAFVLHREPNFPRL